MKTLSVDTVLRSVANYLVMLHSPLLDICQTRLLQQIVSGARVVEYGDMSNLTVRFERIDIDAQLTLELSVDRSGVSKVTFFDPEGNECCMAPIKVSVNWCSSGSCSVKLAAALLDVYKEAVRICAIVQQMVPESVSYVTRTAFSIKEDMEIEEDAIVIEFAEKYGKGLRVGQERAVDINRMPVKVPMGTHTAGMHLDTAKHREYEITIGGDSVKVRRAR